jgi:DNA-binding transcriptional regulator GbsR (MarR family)
MKLEKAKKDFIALWGNFGSQWGINKSMAQVHALLLVAEKELSAEDIMEELTISRGNANMNVRELVNWNLVYKVSLAGERKEFFKAEKDMWEVAKRITKERKRREIEPLQQHLSQLKTVEVTEESASFRATIENIDRLVSRMDSLSNTLMKAEEHVFFGKILNLFK